MFKDLLTFDVLYEANEEMFGLGNCIMLRNFGPLKAGDTIPVIWFDLAGGEATTYDEDEITATHKFSFRLEA